MIEPQSQGIGQAVPIPAQVVREEGKGIRRLRIRRSRKRLRTGEITFLWVSRVIVWVFGIIILIPAVWVVGSSFQPGQLFTTTLFPSGFTLDHYHLLLTQTDFLTWVRNSVFVCTIVGVVTVLLVATMAYAFSRFRFRGRKYGLMGLLLIQMFPAQMSFVAFFVLLNYFNLLDNLNALALVLIGGGLPFNAWLFKGYIDSLPRDLEEAAYVDGASKFQAYLRIILPLCRPMMAVIFLFTWFGIYSEFIITSTLIQNPGNYTMPLGLHGYIQNQFTANWANFAAGAVLGTVPLMLVFLGAQRFLVAGLSRGAVKG